MPLTPSFLSSFLSGLLVLVNFATAAPAIDQIVFGDLGSELAHNLQATLSETAVGPSGTGLAQPYRVFKPATPAGIYGGSVTFTMEVDPVRRNYFSAKMWGGEDGVNDSTHRGRLYVYVLIDGVEYQLGYRHEGDHVANLSNDAPFPSLPGRFFYSTVVLPLWMTQGRQELTFKIVASGRIYALGAGYEGTGGNYQFNMTKNSRGLYRAYTHLEPRLEPVGETQGTGPIVSVKTEGTPQSYLGSSGSFYNSVRGQINNRLNNTLSLSSSIFQPGGVEFLAASYHAAGKIDAQQTALPGFQNPAVVTRVRDLIDLYATSFFADPSGAAGWGGAYGPLGYAIWLLRDHFGADLDASADYGTAGGLRTRRSAWADLLHASREYGRFNRRWLTNQTLIADENIYKANLGLLALGDGRAMSDSLAQRYLREACGLEPWRGSDLSAGGSALPFGADYRQVTEKGLTREWGYVGANYGEMVHHVIDFYRMTGAQAFRDQAVKMLKARAPFRTPSFELRNGLHHRRMAAIGFLAWRGAGESDGNGFGGDTAYGERPGATGGMAAAAATLDPYAIGYAKQMLADRQFFTMLANPGTLDALHLFEDYATVRDAADSGIRLPMTEGQPDFVWADEENGVVALKRGTDRLWIAPYWQAKAGTGINGVARFHYSNGIWDQIGTMEVTPLFDFGGRFFVRPARIDKPEADLYVPPSPPLNAYAGEKLPLGIVPADATSDDPFRGRVDFYAFRFGRYLFGMNRDDEARVLRTPVGFSSAADLASGATVSGPVTVAARQTVVLDLVADSDSVPVPSTPAWLDIEHGADGPRLFWPATSGAESYVVRRSTHATGPFEVIASTVQTLYYEDSDVSVGERYYYTVSAVNAHGESYPSHQYSVIARPGRSILSFNLAPVNGPAMGAAELAGAPGVRVGNWNHFSGGTFSGAPSNAAGDSVAGLGVALSNGNSGGMSDRGGASSADGLMIRTVFDKFSGTAATLSVTGIPFASYDLLFYVHPDESLSGANNRGGSFTVGAQTFFVRTGSAVAIGGPDDYVRATSTTLGTGMNVVLANYAHFEALTGNLTATFTAQDINGGALRLKVAGFQIVGRAPSTPDGLTATAGDAGIGLGWAPVAGADVTYSIRRATSAEGHFVAVATNVAETAFTDTTTAPGKTYYYQVTAANNAGQSGPSLVAHATSLPAAPNGLVLSASSPDRIVLSWSPSSGAASYAVERALGGETLYTRVAEGLGVTSYTDTGVSGGTVYSYRVFAESNGVFGPASLASSILTPPAAPLEVIASGGVRSISLQWSLVHGATHYSVRRSTALAGPYVLAADGLNMTSYVDSDLGNGLDYFYIVNASNATGSGSDSVVVSARTTPLPPAPLSPAAIGGDARVALNWTASTFADTYSVWRSTVPDAGYTRLVSNLITTHFEDTNLTNGTAYFYVITASNAAGEGPVSVAVSATPSAPRDALIEAWRESFFGIRTSSGAADDYADPDGDGLENLLEYALGTNPTLAGGHTWSLQRIEQSSILSFWRIADPSLTYVIQVSSDLSLWVESWRSEGDSNLAGQVSVPAPALAPGDMRQFIRLMVNR